MCCLINYLVFREGKLGFHRTQLIIVSVDRKNGKIETWFSFVSGPRMFSTDGVSLLFVFMLVIIEYELREKIIYETDNKKKIKERNLTCEHQVKAAVTVVTLLHFCCFRKHSHLTVSQEKHQGG